MRENVLLIGIVLMVCIAATDVQTQSPMIHYQGKLLNAEGEPVNETVSIVFRIYNLQTGGNPLWDEVHMAVGVASGVFNVLLGSVTPIPESVFDGTDLWLGMQVGSDTEMVPRQPIASVGYALRANTANEADYVADADMVDGQHASAFAQSEHGHSCLSASDGNPAEAVFVDESGNVGVGTSSPQDKLHVAGTVQMSGFKMDSGASDGYVLTCDGSGGGTWQEMVSSGGYWSYTAGRLTPNNDTDVVGIGSSAAPYDGRLNVYANDSMYGIYIIGSSASSAGLRCTANGALYAIQGIGSEGQTSAIAGDASGALYGVYGRGSNGKTAGVYGEATGADYGVVGKGSSSKTAGIYGEANGADVGVYGKGSENEAAGIWGHANGAAFGIFGTGDEDGTAGIYAMANGAEYGLYGEGSSGKTAAVHGYANNANYGVHGKGSSTKTAAVYGQANGAQYGVYAQGSASSQFGMYADANGATYAICADGSSEKPSAIFGDSDGADYGVWGNSNETAGVYGSGGDYGVYSSGNFGCSGTKAAVVHTSSGPTEMYAVESPELWFEDVGSGRLTDGQARIDLDARFLETVTIDESNPMKVFIQLNDDCKGVYVEKGKNGFEVKELQGGTSDARFDFRVLAKRSGYEQQRMKVTACCYMDRFIYEDDHDPAIPLKWKEKREMRKEIEERGHRTDE